MPSPRLIYRTLGRDLKALKVYFKTLAYVKGCHFMNLSLVDIFNNNATRRAGEVCFVFEGEEWTYQQVLDFTNKVAHCFLQQGLRKGDEVALIMENCPEYVCIWLGLAKIGVITALINTNQKANSLAHSINVINSRAVIYGESLSESVNEAIPLVTNKDTIDFYCYSRKVANTDSLSPFPSKSLTTLLDDASPANIDSKKHGVGFLDKLIYIYTSGTTGMPKAAIIRHSRFMWIAAASNYVLMMKGPQTFYNPLPMYHTSGGIVFLGVVLMFGGKMVLRKKFSASNFWKEINTHKATVSQYIGEICRYLLNQPKVPGETEHSLQLIMGNGLKPHLWTEFQNRFKIARICEFYGATEGNANLVNMFGKVGAVGFVSRLMDRVYPIHLIKINPETGEPLRDENGLCIVCKPGEPGEVVGKIRKNNPLNSFDGYVSSTDTKKKIVKNCFKKGDMAFLSGDLMVMDEDGYLYFMDRTGDTFRWKGENVSTTEVENIVSKVLGFVSCVVYGVEIPGTDGRAGMAAVQMNEQNTDFAEMYQEFSKKLPTYAVPLFIRNCSDIEATGTYKLRKVALQKEGCDPNNIKDPIYFLDLKQKKYVPLTKELWADIVGGKYKL